MSTRPQTPALPPKNGPATIAALLVVQVAFASQAVEAKVAMMPRALGGEGISPLAIAMARMAVGALFFQVYLRVVYPELAKEKLAGKDHARLFGLSLLGITLNQALFLMGLGKTSPFAAALLSASIPVATAGLGALFGVEKLRARTAVGLAVAISGVLVLTGVRSVDRGAALVAVNSLMYASYLVLSKSTIERLGALRVVTWAFTWGALSFVPFGAVALVHEVPTLQPRGFALVGYILLMPTIVAYALNAWALGRTSPTVVTAFIYLQPLLAAGLAYVQLGQGVTGAAGVSAVLILTGVGIVASGKRAPSKVAISSDSPGK